MSFKVGDKVVIQKGVELYAFHKSYAGIYTVDNVFDESDRQWCSIAELKKSWQPCVFRHATPAEIAAGRRIEIFGNSEELEVLEMVDVSPNCEVSEL